MTESIEISKRQIWKRARALMKTHEIMDGSGHLYLTTRAHLSKEQVQSVQEFVHAELEKQCIAPERREFLNDLIRQTLYGLTRRNPPRPAKPAKTKQKKQKKGQQTRPQLTVKKANPRVETRQVVIQVVVKKARTFHYPPDLPGSDL